MARGRPPKYTQELADVICSHIATGVPEQTAAEVCGVSYYAFRQWKQKRTHFKAAIKRARSKAILERVKGIQQAALGGFEIETTEKVIKHKDGKIEKIVIKKKTAPQWTASAWWLERQECDQFGLNRLDLKELLQLLRAAKKERLEIARGDERDQRPRQRITAS